MTADYSLEPPPAPRRPLFARPVATGLIGVLVGAFIVGVPWLAIGLLGGGPSGRPLTAPATLGGLSKAEEAIAKLNAAKGVDAAKGQAPIDRVEKTDRETGAGVSAAYGGAGAVVQQYQDDGFQRGFQLIAVRASAPELWAPYEDVASLGLAVPSQELVRVGAVQCLRHNGSVPAGLKPDPELSFVTDCQRSGANLTVTLRMTTAEGNHDAEELAGIVEEAW